MSHVWDFVRFLVMFSKSNWFITPIFWLVKPNDKPIKCQKNYPAEAVTRFLFENAAIYCRLFQRFDYSSKNWGNNNNLRSVIEYDIIHIKKQYKNYEKNANNYTVKAVFMIKIGLYCFSFGIWTSVTLILENPYRLILFIYQSYHFNPILRN